MTEYLISNALNLFIRLVLPILIGVGVGGVVAISAQLLLQAEDKAVSFLFRYCGGLVGVYLTISSSSGSLSPMNTFIVFTFVLIAADCISRFFYSSKGGIAPMALLVFVYLAPFALNAKGEFLNKEIAIQFLQAISPLIAAALVFSLLHALLCLSVSKEYGVIVKAFRPIWLMGFVIVVLRNLTPIASAILVETPNP
jgi:hypothetical protein